MNAPATPAKLRIFELAAPVEGVGLALLLTKALDEPLLVPVGDNRSVLPARAAAAQDCEV